MAESKQNAFATRRPETISEIRRFRLFEENDCVEFLRGVKENRTWVSAMAVVDGSLKADPNFRLSYGMMEGDEKAAFGELRKTVEGAFQKQLLSGGGKFVLSDLIVNRYGIGGHFSPHMDAIATHHRYRRYSVVSFLNDGFSGGALAFPNLSTSIRLEVGQGIIFPSHYLHQAEAVQSGEKFSLVFYLCDPAMMP